MHTQKSVSVFTNCVRTCLRLFLKRQQQQQPSQLLSHSSRQQLNCLRATATCATTSKLQVQQRQLWNVNKDFLQQQQRQQHQMQQQPQCTITTYATLQHFRPTPIPPPPLSEEGAHELITNLKDSERAAIKRALEKYEAQVQKQDFEGALAASQWRTRFGRPSKVPRLGEVDPTGSFCTFPDDWLKQKLVEKAKPPTMRDLRTIFCVNAVPFIAFGFLDNFVMIVAGDRIEELLGFFVCISTMAAAGLGNTLSDVLGIGSAYYVERGCDMMGLRLPDLTPIQLEMKSSRRAANWGRILGITMGCLLGMSPLLFIKKKEDPKSEEKQ